VKTLRLLLVDDELDTLAAYSLLLELHGFEVDCASDGAQALYLARSRRPDLVMTDLMMPGVDGRALCSLLRADPLLADVPVVLATAAMTPVDAPDGLFDRIMLKPVAIDTLLETIAALARHPGEDTPSPDA
jgi:DNA-binding response OmpR family regulator